MFAAVGRDPDYMSVFAPSMRSEFAVDIGGQYYFISTIAARIALDPVYQLKALNYDCEVFTNGFNSYLYLKYLLIEPSYYILSSTVIRYG